MTARSPARGLSLAALVMLLAACSAAGDGPPSTPTIDHPTGTALVFGVTTSGGFVGPDTQLTTVPSFTLTGDGRVIVPGPQVAIYPGPALPNLQVRTLTPAGMNQVLGRISDSGAFSESRRLSGASMVVADAPDTVFTLNADGREVVVSVYALGFLTDGDQLPPGFPAEEIAFQQQLIALETALADPDSWLGADAWAGQWQAEQPEALRLLVTNVDGVTPDPLAGDPHPWPLAGDAATFGEPATYAANRCGVVSGADADAWWGALGESNQLTWWSSNGHLYQVSPRSLLPYEEASCPNPAG